MEVGGLDVPTSGSVFMNGMDISKFNDEKMSRIRRQNIGFVFQFYNLIPNLNVAENIMLPLLLDGKKMRDYKKPLKDILEVVGLSDKRGHTPRELSGDNSNVRRTLPWYNNSIDTFRQITFYQNFISVIFRI